MSNLKKIPIEQTTLSNDFTNTYKSEVETAYTNNHTHSNKSILDTVSGSNTGDETLSTILTKVCASKVTCSTASATTEKTVSVSGFSLVSGVTVKVTFTNANTTASPTLNINSTGAKAIYSEDGVAVSATNPFYVPAGATVEFTYDGVNWVYKNRIISNYINGATWYQQWTNGFIKQGGFTYEGSVTFPIAFPHACLTVVATPQDAGNVAAWLSGSPSTTGCVIYIGPADSGGPNSRWIATGY